MKIHTIPDPVEGAKRAAETLARTLQGYGKRPILFLVSGGSTVPMLAYIPKHVFGPHVTVVVLDERYSADPVVNNFLQLKVQPVYKAMKAAGCAFIETIPMSHESLEEFAQRYEQELREWHKGHPGGKMVATQGIGIDGHTVGIFPLGSARGKPSKAEKDWFMKQFDATDRWVVGYDARLQRKSLHGGQAVQHPLRATTTFPLLRMLDAAILYCYGNKKQGAISRALAKTGTLVETPGRIIHEMKNVDVFTDAIIQ